MFGVRNPPLPLQMWVFQEPFSNPLSILIGRGDLRDGVGRETVWTSKSGRVTEASTQFETELGGWTGPRRPGSAFE